MVTQTQAFAITLTMAVLCTCPAACKRRERPAPPAGNEKRTPAEVLLPGVWTRASEVAPTVYEQVFEDDGTFIQRQYSQSSDAVVALSEKTRRHRRYSLDLPLTHESTGRWKLIEATTLVLQVNLTGGDPLTHRCRIERISASQLTVSSDGLNGPVNVTYQRVKDIPGTRPGM